MLTRQGREAQKKGFKSEDVEILSNAAQVSDPEYLMNPQFFGKSMVFFETGKVKHTSTYKDGLLNGVVTDYFENGQIKNIVQWIDDKPNGIEKRYRDNGVIKTINTYENGRLLEEKLFNDRGILVSEIVKTGKGVIKTIYNKNGEVLNSETTTIPR